MSGAFQRLLRTPAAASPLQLTVDCANGVGAPKLSAVLAAIGSVMTATLVKIDVADESALNHLCGADHVKVGQMPPQGVVLQVPNPNPNPYPYPNPNRIHYPNLSPNVPLIIDPLHHTVIFLFLL